MKIVRGPQEPVHEFQSRRRREALHLFETAPDLPLLEVARRVGVTPKYVRRWRDAFLSGDRSFVEAARPGHQPHLTTEQRELIRQHIIAGPKAAGYEQQLWTQRRIADLILKLTGVSYHPVGIRVLMASMNISYQKPALRTRQKSEKKKADFLEQTWVDVKKGNQGSSK